jgi:hypothetical protein
VLCVATGRGMGANWMCVFVGVRGRGQGGVESKWYKSVEIAQFLPTTQNKRERNIT